MLPFFFVLRRYDTTSAAVCQRYFGEKCREEKNFPFFGRAADFCAPCIVFPPRGKTICRSRTKERRRAHEGEEPEQGAEHQSEPGAEPEHQPALSLHKNGKGTASCRPLPAFLPANLFLYFPVRFYIIGALSFRKGSGA